MDSIFTNTNVFNLSDPMGTWLFDVQFFNVNPTAGGLNKFLTEKSTNGDLVVTSCTLPGHETEIVTRNYFGSEKSYPILRKYGGDCEMRFDIRAENDDNATLYRITQVNTRKLVDGADRIIYHPEVELRAPDQYAEIVPMARFQKVTIGLINKTKMYGSGDDATQKKYHSQYDLHNCIVTSFKFDNGLDYNSEDKLTCSLTLHYDIWSYHSDVDVTE